MRLLRGASTIAFAALLLPILIVCGSLALDLERYFRISRSIQQIADRAALDGAEQLPYKFRAHAAVEEALSGGRLERLFESRRIEALPGAMLVELRASPRFVIGSLLLQGASADTVAQALARRSPSDVMIVADLSGDTAPAHSSGDGWGDPLAWPAAEYFSFYGEQAARDGPVPARVSTAQCFNPQLSLIKLAAVRLHAITAADPESRVAVAVAPGFGAPLEQLSALATSSTRTNGEARIIDYRGMHNSNALCAAVAEFEQHSSVYRMPSAVSGVTAGWTHPEGRPQSMLSPGSLMFDYSYQPYHSVREALWIQAAREAQKMNLAEVIAQAGYELLGATVPSGGAFQRSRVRSVLVVGGSAAAGGARFPAAAASGALTSRLAELKDRYLETLALYGGDRPAFRFEVIFIVVDAMEAPSQISRDEFERLQQLFAALSGSGFSARLMRLRRMEELDWDIPKVIIDALAPAVLMR